MHWYIKAAEQRDIGVHKSLIKYYYEGEIVDKSLERAFYWERNSPTIS